MIYNDLKAKARWLYQSDNPKMIVRAFFSDATLSMILYRAMALCSKYWVTRAFAFVIMKINAIICGCVIGIDARFGKNFIILHSVGIVINSKVRGEDNIILESGVVIGEEKGGCPTLGNNIFIGSGAKVIGRVHIGNNVTVGANAVVTKDVCDYATVAGVPAKIINYRK
jgi:serine O-acetyltransferase